MEKTSLEQCKDYKLTGNLKRDVEYLNLYLKVNQNFDLICRRITIGNREACMYLVDGFCKDDLMQKLLQY